QSGAYGRRRGGALPRPCGFSTVVLSRRADSGSRLRSSDGNTKRRGRLAWAALGLISALSACTSIGDSPRAPYAHPAGIEAGRDEARGAGPFRLAGAASVRRPAGEGRGAEI